MTRQTFDAAAILPTENEAWGFYGTSLNAPIDGLAGAAAWNAAFRKILEAAPLDAETVRAFLDSRMGRHFADEAYGKGLDGAIDAWTSRTFTARDERHHGIPRGAAAGLDHLTAFAEMARIELEMTL